MVKYGILALIVSIFVLVSVVVGFPSDTWNNGRSLNYESFPGDPGETVDSIPIETRYSATPTHTPHMYNQLIHVPGLYSTGTEVIDPLAWLDNEIGRREYEIAILKAIRSRIVTEL